MFASLAFQTSMQECFVIDADQVFQPLQHELRDQRVQQVGLEGERALSMLDYMSLMLGSFLSYSQTLDQYFITHRRVWSA